MDFKALLKIGVVAGVLMNVVDVIVQGNVMAGLYVSPVFRDPIGELPALILVDFVAAFVFAWIYLELGQAAGPGIKGGARFGFYVGVLYSFPMFISMHLLFNGYSYSLAWINTVYQIAVYVIVGVVAAVLTRRRPARAVV